MIGALNNLKSKQLNKFKKISLFEESEMNYFMHIIMLILLFSCMVSSFPNLLSIFLLFNIVDSSCEVVIFVQVFRLIFYFLVLMFSLLFYIHVYTYQ